MSSTSPEAAKTTEERRKSFARRASTSIKSKEREHIVVYLPANYPSCPPGLEKLIAADHLFVRQGIRMQEPPFTMISKHKFEVLNGIGQRIFLAREATDNILKLCCRGGCGQPFEMSIKDRHSGYEILAVNGHPDCYGALTASVSQNGMTLGFINEELRCCSSNYSLIDAQGNEIFRIYDVSSFRTKWNHNESLTRKINSEISKEEEDDKNDDSITSSRKNDNNHKNPSNPNNNNHQQGPNSTLGETPSTSASCHTFHDDTDTNPTTIITTKTIPISSLSKATGSSVKSNKSSGSSSKKVTYNLDEDANNLPSCSTSSIPPRAQAQSTPSKSEKNSKSSNCCLCNFGLGRCLDSCVSLISGGVEFDLYSCEMGVVVGKMGKQWGDLYDQYFNLVDCFGVNFPRSLSVRHKVLILGALFLLVSFSLICIYYYLLACC